MSTYLRLNDISLWPPAHHIAVPQRRGSGAHIRHRGPRLVRPIAHVHHAHHALILNELRSPLVELRAVDLAQRGQVLDVVRAVAPRVGAHRPVCEDVREAEGVDDLFCSIPATMLGFKNRNGRCTTHWGRFTDDKTHARFALYTAFKRECSGFQGSRKEIPGTIRKHTGHPISFWLPSPYNLVQVPRTVLAGQLFPDMSDIDLDFFPSPAKRICHKKNIALDVRCDSRMSIFPNVLQYRVLWPVANRVLLKIISI